MKALTIFLTLLALTGCSPDRATGPSVPTDELKSAPVEFGLSGLTYTLEASLWRDFMPVSPPDGQPMIAVAKILEVDSQTIPVDLAVATVWVVSEYEVWETLPAETRRSSATPYIVEVVARDGPKWEPGMKVDVIVQITMGNGDTFLLRASDQVIFRTD